MRLPRRSGAYRGRKKTLSLEWVDELRRRANAGEPKTKLAHEYGISRKPPYP